MSRLRTIRERAAPLALLAFAIAGATGHWSELPPWALLAGLGLLPGFAVLGACRARCARERRACLAEGPAAIASALAFSVVLLLPTVAPLFFVHAPLAQARWTLGVVLAGIALVALALPLEASSCASSRPWRDRVAEWLVALAVIAALLPAVAVYAGGTVDDWWDLAFVRAYAERPAMSFSEPFLGTERAHPRFAWNGWLILQSLVLAFTGADPADVQAGALAALVCVASVAASVAFLRGMLGAARAAVIASLLFLPLWLWGTEAMPYFARLHQDKFVVGLVFVPLLLGCAIDYLERGGSRELALAAIACVAAASVHGVVFAVGAFGVAICSAVAYVRSPASAALARVARLAVIVAIAATYPAWQAVALRSWFIAEGISLAAADNPVVRAHLWLERLIGAGTRAYIVHPTAVFGPIALVMLPALLVARRAGREQGWAYAAALAILPSSVIFVPFVAAAAGTLFVPWMLYRLGWLVPVAALAGAAVTTLWMRGTRRARVLSALLVTASLLLAVPTAIDRTRRGMMEHPSLRERAPRGNEREVYRFLRLWPESGAVVAAPGFAGLVAAMSGRSTVAVSERGTLVFSGDELDAYRRLRDRAAFFAETTSSERRDEIARAYGVRLAVFRKRFVGDGSERAWLWRATAEGFLHGAARSGSRQWTRARVRAAVPEDWRIVLANRDFVVVRTPYDTRVDDRKAQEARAASWLDVFETHAPDPPVDSAVLASLSGWPGARVTLKPVPLSLGMTERPVWTAGALVWDDGPDAVRVTLDLGAECFVKAIVIVPFLRTGRREVFEVTALGATRRLRALDGQPLHVVLPVATRVRKIGVGVRSMLGEQFALWDVRILGDRHSCAGGWRPLPRPALVAGDVSRADLLGLAARYPNDARAALGIVRRLGADAKREDAIALLRAALARDPAAAPAWVELGLMLDAEGHGDEALASYERGLAADSNNAWARGCVAWAELRRSRPVRALWQAYRASRLDARYADAFTIMAAAVRQLGLRDAATRMLRRAIHLDPNRSWPYLELAQLHVDGGEPQAAIHVLDRFLEIVPDDPQAQEMIAGIKASEAPSS